MGAYTQSDSFYGTFDQGGNVWEWNEAIIAGSSRGLRGGNCSTSAITLTASGRGGTGFPTSVGPDIGFRVASVPEPGSLVMLAGIALTALLYWWRKHA